MDDSGREWPVEFDASTKVKAGDGLKAVICLVLTGWVFALGLSVWLLLAVATLGWWARFGYNVGRPTVRVFEDSLDYGGQFFERTRRVPREHIGKIERRDSKLMSDKLIVHTGEGDDVEIELSLVDRDYHSRLQALLEEFADADSAEC